MKIYLFNPESGVYLGEDFADEAATYRGADLVPPDATTVAPPSLRRGEIAVYDEGEERWRVIPQGALPALMSVDEIIPEGRE
ncbi:hypothetical protein [Geobacter sp. DSM 9736]|uniref:hypothetical protein n=1 Tax=Geobacter sp. DSM 9736 TaxID=1277350 RepID=UPI000B4FFE9B|nr:hypothetical protein [Geobacter sp. DSM 9736]SNB47520.1 hypothetical protein SAMN06269301_3010 [Geobacter sp. DSM 9736]